jgi:hypothetical protein
MAKKDFIPNKLKPWVEARKKYHLSHAQIQMARELGLNPKKFGSHGNTKQQQWKLPLSAPDGLIVSRRRREICQCSR